MKIKKKELRIAMAENDMNQSQLAKKIGITPCYMSNVINRYSPSDKVVKKIADVLGKKPEDIAEWEVK